MIEPSLAFQQAIRARLIDDNDVLMELPYEAIRDGSARPDQFPVVIIGDGQTVLEQITFSRKHVRVYLDLHIWTQEGGFAQVKTIAQIVTRALGTAPAITGFALLDFLVKGIRYMRDPGGEHGHAVVSLEALIEAVE